MPRCFPRSLIIALGFGWCSLIAAQDLVVRRGGDSLNCRIRGSDSNGIHYVHLYKGKPERVYLAFGEVLAWKQGFYTANFRQGQTIRDLRGHPYFRLAFFGGCGWLAGKIEEDLPDQIKEHGKRLRFGTFFGGEFHYMVSDRWGLGLQSFVARHTAVTDGVLFYATDNTTALGRLKDDVTLRYVAPSIMYRNYLLDRVLTYGVTLGVGPVSYRNKGMLYLPIELVGDSFGARLAADLEWQSEIGLGVGVTFSKMFSSLQNLRLVGDPIGFDLLYGTSLSLGRWDAGLGLSYTY